MLTHGGISLAVVGRSTKVIAEDKIIDFEKVSNSAVNVIMVTADTILQYMTKYGNAQRKNANISQAKGICAQTIRNIDEELGISGGKAKTTTTARLGAEADLRHAILIAAANHLIVQLVKCNLILNMDATQFRVGTNVDEKQIVKHLRRNPATGKKRNKN